MSFRNYEHIVRTHQSSPVVGENQLPDEIKFRVVSYFNVFLISPSLNSPLCSSITCRSITAFD